MCGVCGIFSPAGAGAEDIEAMLCAIAHRGPDEAGIHIDGPIGLGSRRLSIIDLLSGRQPICNEEGTIWIVCNGEIYNFQALRRGLEQSGHRFRTNTDTEVIVHLYEEFDEGCVNRLSGMFAFAVWDAPQQKLFLARDRLGQKPLYYSFVAGEFLFASEPKALLAASKQPPEMDLAAVHDFLSLRFIPPPRTLFRHIQKIPPAHCLVFQHGEVTLRRYWQLSFRSKLKISEPELLEDLAEKLRRTVSVHLVSDVPVGAFLSGGLDSSMIVAILARDLGQKPRTFSIGVEEGDFDELPYARLVADACGARHSEQRVAANLIQSLPKMIWHLDEPSDPIAACIYLAAGLAGKEVKVVLGGDGGDELFAGFDRYLGGRFVNAYARIPFALRTGVLGPLLAWLPDSFTYKSATQKARWVHRLSLQPTAAEQYAAATCFFRFGHADKQTLYSPEFWGQVGDRDSARVIADPFENGNADDLLDRMLYADYMTRLPEHSLMLVDRMTMAHGLEVRSPFLDHELVEYLARVPGSLKIRNDRLKYLLRRLAAGYLPETIVRREKQGFMLPIAYWFRGDLYPWLSTTLLNSFFVRVGLFAQAAVQRLLHEHRSRRCDHHVRLWMLLSLEIWHQLFIEQVDCEAVAERLLWPARALN